VSATSIVALLAYEALDSRGRPTVACVAELAGGAHAQAIVPSGASIGTHEAYELRDGGPRFGGGGVLTAVANVNGPIRDALLGFDAREQVGLDECLRQLDGSPNFGRLGGNAVLAVSIACCRAAARAAGVPLFLWISDGRPLLPLPMINILSGGQHARGMADVQDYLAVPTGAASFGEAIRWVSDVRKAAAELAELRGVSSQLVADEGGLALPLRANEDGVEFVMRAIERAGLRPGDQVGIAIDLAANQFFNGARYILESEQLSLAAAELVDMLVRWTKTWPIVSLEDPLAEDDWAGWAEASHQLASLQLIGDDLFATSLTRLGQGLERGLANAILIKLNQNGTVTGAHEVLTAAKRAGFATIMSARSGDTEDASLADFAVGWGAGQIKVGSLTRSERTAKWNRLLRIEQEHDVGYAGSSALAPARSSYDTV